MPVLRDRPELTQVLEQRARQRVLERYTFSQNISQLESLYAEVQQKRSSLKYFT